MFTVGIFCLLRDGNEMDLIKKKSTVGEKGRRFKKNDGKPMGMSLVLSTYVNH